MTRGSIGVRVAIAAAAIGVLVGGAWLVRSVSNERELVRVEVFEKPGSICREHRRRTYVEQVDEVARTSPDLRERVALVQAGFIRITARRSDTPGFLTPALRSMADALVAGDFNRARLLAESVDRYASERCG